MVFSTDAADEAADEASLGQIVNNGEFFGDHEGITDKRQCAAENRNLRPLGRPRKATGKHTRNGHHSVRGLMMLIESEDIPAEFIREFELRQVILIERGTLLRIVVAIRQRYPRRPVA